jgi:methyl-accepting chemotaxis protein
MAPATVTRVSYLRKLFFATHLTGLAAGGLFPLLVSPLLGPAALKWPFMLSCLAMGFGVGAFLFFFVRLTLKQQQRRQLELLRPLAGEIRLPEETVEALDEAVAHSVAQVEGLVRRLIETVDAFVPHYRTLAEWSGFLSDRAQEGLAAARTTRGDIEALAEKQREVMEKVATLGNNAQDEAALSRQIAASQEETAEAMERSSGKFLETTASVDEMASSVLEVAAQAEEIAHGVEGTARDLDELRDSLEKIRAGASASSQAAGAVKKDAESGLLVVKTSMEEMQRIEQESQRATTAMERLSRQTGEVAKIIEVIRELVSDTELLAFNAAIIAAKAGEHGKGFAVVAEEIRDLADRTTTSAQDIQRIVQAIGGDTREVLEAVEATGMRIAKGKQLSLSTGEALKKIVESAGGAAGASEEIAALTSRQWERARALLEEAGHSLRSVRAIARAMQEQQTAIVRIQGGVNQMKEAGDQIARSMEEQVRANRTLERGLHDRQGQIEGISRATTFQMTTAQRVFDHFAVSERRLQGNAEKAAIITREIADLEVLAGRLRELAETFTRRGNTAPQPQPRLTVSPRR